MLEWLMSDWQAWFARAIVAAMISDAVASLYLAYIFWRRQNRGALHIAVVFFAWAIKSALLLPILHSIPDGFRLMSISPYAWFRVGAHLAGVAATWRFALYVRGKLD